MMMAMGFSFSDVDFTAAIAFKVCGLIVSGQLLRHTKERTSPPLTRRNFNSTHRWRGIHGYFRGLSMMRGGTILHDVMLRYLLLDEPNLTDNCFYRTVYPVLLLSVKPMIGRLLHETYKAAHTTHSEWATPA